MVSGTGGSELLPDKEMIEPLAPSITGASSATKLESTFGSAEFPDSKSEDDALNEPVLSADELRALLQDQPTMPPSGNAEER
jgi:hypothetical protein